MAKLPFLPLSFPVRRKLVTAISSQCFHADVHKVVVMEDKNLYIHVPVNFSIDGIHLNFFVRSDTMVVDIGPPADWVKINVQRTVCLSSTTL